MVHVVVQNPPRTATSTTQTDAVETPVVDEHSTQTDPAVKPAIGGRHPELSASSSHYTVISVEPVVKAVLNLKIHGISEFIEEEDQELSSAVLAGGIEWRLSAKPVETDGNRLLSCQVEAIRGGTWSAWVSAMANVVQQNGGTDFNRQFHDELFGQSPLASHCGFPNFISKDVCVSAETLTTAFL